MRLCLVLLCLTFSLSAQVTLPVPTPALSSLRSYFTLTPEQERSIASRLAAFSQYQSQKLQRQAQVNLELTQEYQRPSIDPMALGLRYLELSSIQRELTEEQAKITTDVRAVLTDQQRQKLVALEEVNKLQNTVCEAQQVGLLLPAPNDFASFLLSTSPVISLNPIGIPSGTISSRIGLGCSLNTGLARFLTLPQPVTNTPAQ